jgi:hypothetical protein
MLVIFLIKTKGKGPKVKKLVENGSLQLLPSTSKPKLETSSI